MRSHKFIIMCLNGDAAALITFTAVNFFWIFSGVDSIFEPSAFRCYSTGSETLRFNSSEER